MEKHRNELLKICCVCQIQLTKPFYSLRLVISVDSLRNLIFPYDCNLYPTNVCQQCKRKVEKEIFAGLIKAGQPAARLPGTQWIWQKQLSMLV